MRKVVFQESPFPFLELLVSVGFTDNDFIIARIIDQMEGWL